MVKVLILGSSGMVGSEVLNECIKSRKITKITAVSRKRSIKRKKVKEVVHENFLDFSRIKKEISGNDICFYCVGVYQGDVPKDKFIEVTHDYLIALASAIESKKTVFCLFSAQAANPASKVLFARWKGQAETDLMKFNFKDIYIFRPGYIHPTDKSRLRKTIPYMIFELMYPVVDLFFPKYCTNSKQLARVMVKVGLNGSRKKIFENMETREG